MKITNIVIYVKNIIKFRKRKAFGMSYREFCKSDIFQSDEDVPFKDDALNKFTCNKQLQQTEDVFDEFSAKKYYDMSSEILNKKKAVKWSEITMVKSNNGKKVDKLTNDEYDELSKKADENIRMKNHLDSETGKQLKLIKFK